MKIIKCDMCKKRISSGMDAIRIGISKPDFYSFEICFNCGKPIIKMLKDKKLIKNEKINKTHGRKK